jgi:hypothetical protein
MNGAGNQEKDKNLKSNGFFLALGKKSCAAEFSEPQ